MIKRIKNKLRRMLYGPPVETNPSEVMVERLRSLGMRIGQRTIFFDPHSCIVDETRPWLVEIGDDVQITHGVIILTHGYDWSVLKGLYGEVLGSSGKVTIGNNVFIGMNTIILKGVTIGNNVIIGAGSLVNKDVPDNCVVAGNPARVITTVEEYHKKRQEAQEAEARELVEEYRKVYGREPDEAALGEFFWLFTNEPEKVTHPSWVRRMNCVGNREFSDRVIGQNRKKYEDMEDFLKHC